ncbi:hypothetical protein Rsub_08221 [Raphidocelis subcapitata]|uniref:EF-hand domain-containing protein n=1 Tax=Raphidocelis subcapitata TaxID=307507 RepID=A0A2V0PFD5_9CHLO|nr:hypothetical protein Rsub_08221 [Raphidocelis subcapitata]|eukprot:GBF95785.1 hypothetical protein Rsub_08221 [Raphidocelis subcapitata]
MACCFKLPSDEGMLKKVRAVIENPNLLQKPVNVAFRTFDRDRNGYIDAGEVHRVVSSACRRLGFIAPPYTAISVVFDKMAGNNGRLTKEQFTEGLRKVCFMAEKDHAEKVGVEPIADSIPDMPTK